MDIAAATSAQSTMTQGNVKTQAALLVQRKSMDIEENHAQQLINALPKAQAVDPSATVGGRVNTFA